MDVVTADAAATVVMNDQRLVSEKQNAGLPNEEQKEDEKFAVADIAEREHKSPIKSKARQRWKLLSNYLRNNSTKARETAKNVETTLVLFEVVSILKTSEAGRWYRIRPPVADIHLDVHIYSPSTVTLLDLVGFNNTGNVRIWPAEEFLAIYLLKHQSVVLNKDVLELGAGMIGLSGLISAVLGAREVVLTDGNVKSVENIVETIKANELTSNVSCQLLYWNHTLPGQQFDTILCADCLFFTEEHYALLDCTHRHLKSGGVAYFMAPDRDGTMGEFLQLVYQDRGRWQNFKFEFHVMNELEISSSLEMSNTDLHLEFPMLLIYQEVIDAVHYFCMCIQDEVVEDLRKKGQNINFDKEVIAQIAYTICDTLCTTWPDELLQFAKHGKRSAINIFDLRILFRKNESLLAFIEKVAESPLLPARHRQSRKRFTRKNREAGSIGKNDGKNSREVNTVVSESANILKLTDLWDQFPQQEKQMANGAARSVNSQERLREKEEHATKHSRKSTDETNDDVRIVHSTTISDGEKPSICQSDRLDEQRTENLLSQNINFSKMSIPVVQSLKTGTKGQLPIASSVKRSNAADECFSSFKFESDDDELSQTCLFSETSGRSKDNASTVPLKDLKRNSIHCSSNFLQEQKDVGSDALSMDLDATVFDF